MAMDQVGTKVMEKRRKGSRNRRRIDNVSGRLKDARAAGLGVIRDDGKVGARCSRKIPFIARSKGNHFMTGCDERVAVVMHHALASATKVIVVVDLCDFHSLLSGKRI